MHKVVDVQPAHLVAARYPAAAVAALDDGAKASVDRAFPATHRDRLTVAKQEVAHRRVAGQVGADGCGQHRAEVQPRRQFAVGIEVQDHLGAFARWPTRRGGHVKGVEPRLGEAEQAVSPRNVGWVARVAGSFVVWVPQPEFAVAPNLERLLHQCPLVRRQPHRAPPHPVVAVSEAHRPTASPAGSPASSSSPLPSGDRLRARHAG
jgi:hypothetical protein